MDYHKKGKQRRLDDTEEVIFEETVLFEDTEAPLELVGSINLQISKFCWFCHHLRSGLIFESASTKLYLVYIVSFNFNSTVS